MRKIAFIIPFLFLFGTVSIGQQSFPSGESFKNPTLNCYPRPLWFWNDVAVTSTVVEQQMQEFRDSCGYGGFGILPFGKHFSPDYLSEDYFNIYGSALKKAKDLGLTMCLYDEFGFPSGGMGANNADGINRFALKFPGQTIKRLDKVEIEIHESLVNQKVPEGKLLAVIAMEKASLKRVNLRNYLIDGTLKWEVPAGNWKLMFFMCVKDGDPIVDYLDPDAVENFIQMTHEAYYARFKSYFGNVISGTFFDEPTMYRAKGRIWTESFNEKFEKKYGFSPENYYPALWYDIGSETRAARNYLFGFRTELYAESFTRKVNDWSVAHGINATGHQDQEEILNPVSVSGDLMKCFKFLEIPGIDKIGGNRLAERFYKVVSSAANNYDRPMVMSETYGAMGNLSWDEIFSIAMDQYAKGINMLIPHAVWYNDQNVVFKPELSHRNPLYADSLKIFNQFLARLNLVLQKSGRHVADIAVLYPIQTLQGEHVLDGPLKPYAGGVNIPKTDYIDVANWLTEDAGKDYSFLHPEVLDEKCSVYDGKLQLKNAVNREEYKVLILPSCKTISISNLNKVKEFYDKGGHLIFTSQLPAFAAEPGKDWEVAKILHSIDFSDGQTTGGSGKGQALFIENPDGLKIRNAIQKSGLRFDVDYPENKDLRYIHKIIDGRDVYYFANIGHSGIETKVKLAGKKKLEIRDPHSGELRKTNSSFEKENGADQTNIALKLEPFHSLFLISK